MSAASAATRSGVRMAPGYRDHAALRRDDGDERNQKRQTRETLLEREPGAAALQPPVQERETQDENEEKEKKKSNKDKMQIEPAATKQHQAGRNNQ